MRRLGRPAPRPTQISKRWDTVRFTSSILSHTLTAMQRSTCRPQRDAPHLPVRPARCTHLARRPAHHPKHERGQPVPPAQNTNNDVLPARTQANRPVGPRRRSVPPRTVVRARAARQGRAHAVHVLAVLRRSTRRESTHPSFTIVSCVRLTDGICCSAWDRNSR